MPGDGGGPTATAQRAIGRNAGRAATGKMFMGAAPANKGKAKPSNAKPSMSAALAGAKKAKSSNPAKAAITGAGIAASSLSGGIPLAAFGVPLGGAAAGAFLHTLMTKPGFQYDDESAGKESSAKLNLLSARPRAPDEQRLASMSPGLDELVADTGRTRRDLWTEGLLHKGGPLAHIVQKDQRKHLDFDVRERLAGVIPEDATVQFDSVRDGNPFVSVVNRGIGPYSGRVISRTPGYMMPVHDEFGLYKRKESLHPSMIAALTSGNKGYA